MRRPTTWIMLLTGLVLLTSVPLALALEAPNEFGQQPTETPDRGPALAADEASPRLAEPPDDDAAADDTQDDDAQDDAEAEESRRGPRLPTEVTTRSARVEDLPAAVARPTRVAIEGLGIDAPVDQVATDADGAMEIPEDVARAGWFRRGPAPGSEQGSSVISAHVDSRTQGKGAFYPLREISEGAEVVVEAADGVERTFEVTTLTRYGKDDLPISELFRRDGAHQLVLITCGGDFDAATGQYAENIVAIAEPVE